LKKNILFIAHLFYLFFHMFPFDVLFSSMFIEIT